MKAKIFSGFAALCVAVQVSAQIVQYVTLTSKTGSNNSLLVQTNQIISMVGYYGFSGLPTVTAHAQDGSSIDLVASQNKPIFTGLTNISVQTNLSGIGAATFQITTPSSENVVSNYVPADAIVIPASATGNVQIILESSPDLVNWTAASPGTYGASAGTNRFFRVRAVVSP